MWRSSSCRVVAIFMGNWMIHRRWNSARLQECATFSQVWQNFHFCANNSRISWVSLSLKMCSIHRERPFCQNTHKSKSSTLSFVLLLNFPISAREAVCFHLLFICTVCHVASRLCSGQNVTKQCWLGRTALCVFMYFVLNKAHSSDQILLFCVMRCSLDVEALLWILHNSLVQFKWVPGVFSFSRERCAPLNSFAAS